MSIKIQLILLLFGLQLYSTHVIKLEESYKTEIVSDKYNGNKEAKRSPEQINQGVKNEFREETDIEDIVTRPKRFIVRQATRRQNQPAYNRNRFNQQTPERRLDKNQYYRRRNKNTRLYTTRLIRRIRARIRNIFKKIRQLFTGKKPTTITTTSLPTTITVPPTTTPIPTTTDSPTTSPAPTTSDSPTTSPSPATSDSPTTSPSPATSDSPTTSPIPTTSDSPTTSSILTTSDSPTILTTPDLPTSPILSPPTALPTTIVIPTTDLPTTIESVTGRLSNTTNEETTEFTDYNTEGILRDTEDELSKHIENVDNDKLNKELENKTNDNHENNPDSSEDKIKLEESDQESYSKFIDKRAAVTNITNEKLNVANSDILKQTDKSYVNIKANTIYENHVGKGHVTNIFIFYPNVDMNKTIETLKPVSSNVYTSPKTEPSAVTQPNKDLTADKINAETPTTNKIESSSITESNDAKSSINLDVTESIPEMNTAKDLSNVESTTASVTKLDSHNTKSDTDSEDITTKINESADKTPPSNDDTKADTTTESSTVTELTTKTSFNTDETNATEEDSSIESSTKTDSEKDEANTKLDSSNEASKESITDSSKETSTGIEPNDIITFTNTGVSKETVDSETEHDASDEKTPKFDLRLPNISI